MARVLTTRIIEIAKLLHRVEVINGVTTTVWDAPDNSLRRVIHRDVYYDQARAVLDYLSAEGK